MENKYSIGEFSELTGISKRMLRHYDKLCLLTPAEVNCENNYRFYLKEQIVELEKIQFLRSLGFTLASIGDILSRPIALTDFLEMLKDQEATLTSESKLINSNIMATNRMITLLKKQSPKVFPSIHKLLDWERSLTMTVDQQMELVDLKTLMHRDLFLEKIDETFEKDRNDTYYFLTFDIDRFKAVNDIDGYEVGDKVIQNMISIVVGNFNPLIDIEPNSNFITRFGGDEVVIFLKNSFHDDVIKHVESTFNQVRAFNFKKIGCTTNPTISCGISFGKKPYHKEVMKKESYKALLESKRNGRNQFMISEYK